MIRKPCVLMFSIRHGSQPLADEIHALRVIGTRDSSRNCAFCAVVNSLPHNTIPLSHLTASTMSRPPMTLECGCCQHAVESAKRRSCLGASAWRQPDDSCFRLVLSSSRIGSIPSSCAPRRHISYSKWRHRRCSSRRTADLHTFYFPL